MAYVKAKSCAAFDCYNAAVAGLYCFVDVVDEVFGFAGAFEAKDKFDHSNVSLCSNVLSLRERSLTENQSSFASIAAFMSSYPGFPRRANMFFL